MKKTTAKVDPKVIENLVAKVYSVQPEQVEPIILDHAMTRLAGFKTLYRSPFGTNGDRFYFTTDVPAFFTGYSSWTHQVLPQEKGLELWKLQMGAERAEFIAAAAREYGSLLHLVISQHEDPGSDFRFRFNDEWWVQTAYEVARANILPASVADTWIYQLRNDMAAYFTWKKEMNVRVLAVEVPLLDTDYMVATPGDLIVAMTVMENEKPRAKKKPVEVVAAIDIKSGDKSVGFPAYRLQLEFIRHAWNKMGFKGTPYEVTRIYNWRPSPRQARPGGYILTDQSGYFTKNQVNALGRLNKVMGYNRPTGGVIEYFDAEDAEQFNAHSMSPAQWLQRWQQDFKNLTTV